MTFYYIAVKSETDGIFVGKDSILTEDFDKVRRFRSEQDAADFIAMNHINDRTRILFYRE